MSHRTAVGTWVQGMPGRKDTAPLWVADGKLELEVK